MKHASLIFNLPKKYPYKPQLKQTLLYIVFCFFCAYVSIGDIISKPYSICSTIIISIFATLTLFGTIILSLALIDSFINKKYVIISKENITCPEVKVFSKRALLIKYSEIVSLNLTKYQKNMHILTIKTSRGKVNIMQPWLKKNEIKDDVNNFFLQ